MTGIIRADALRLPLRDESVHLIVTSPPYYALRSYRDGGDHYDGQIGSEATPQAFLEALWAVTAECWRVLKPSGSCFINLGDKRSGSGGHNNSGISGGPSQLQGASQRGRSDVTASRRNAPDRYNQAAFGRPKSKMLLPHRYAIGCEDGLADPDGVGWIVRQDVVWHKLNGLPESVIDRTRDSHEYIFHLTKSERYFSAVDELREPHAPKTFTHRGGGKAWGNDDNPDNNWTAIREAQDNLARVLDPRGKVPGSVWPIASEPLTIPDWLGVDHFACVDAETEILTKRGWLHHDELRIGDQVGGYVQDPGIARWTTMRDIHRYEYDGEMVAVDKRDLSMRLTPNHRCLVQSRSGRQGVIRADNLRSRHYIPRSAPHWVGGPGIAKAGRPFAALIGWIAAEGWYTETGRVRLSQSTTAHPEHVMAIDALLHAVPKPDPDRTQRQKYRRVLDRVVRTEQHRQWRGRPANSVTWALPLGLSQQVTALMPDKRLPWSVLSWSADDQAALFEAFVDGDGHRRPGGRIAVFQKNRHNLDVLAAIAVRLCYRVRISEGQGRFILYANQGDRALTLRGTDGANLPVGREHYNGIVWCPTTDTGTFYARRHGTVFITGNSFPQEIPRRLILGWSPSGICTACGEGRRPVVAKEYLSIGDTFTGGTPIEGRHNSGVRMGDGVNATITGYACACTPYRDHPERRGTSIVNHTRDDTDGRRAATSDRPVGPRWLRNGSIREYDLAGWTPPPTRPAVVLDPFGGTGTTAMVARALGRVAVNVDLSADYCRLARWRVFSSGHASKTRERTNIERQGTFL